MSSASGCLMSPVPEVQGFVFDIKNQPVQPSVSLEGPNQAGELIRPGGWDTVRTRKLIGNTQLEWRVIPVEGYSSSVFHRGNQSYVPDCLGKMEMDSV